MSNQGDLFGAVSCATLSDCGRYRYTLTRRWAAGGSMLFVMLNPSTADASQDDPTIRRCIGFAKREGFGALEVVNLFAFRATDPAALATAADPIGPDNDRHVLDAAGRSAKIVAAWGASVPGTLRARPAHVERLLRGAGRPLWCLGMTSAGAPRHPLYVRGDAALGPLVRP